ncbi:hypothetical protein LCGC14_1004880, partial [marine sediment metagenome]
VNGSVNLTQSGSQVPVGEAKLTVKGLTRSGLILTSAPVDLGLNIAISTGPDPINSDWYIYTAGFETGAFPDYPKYSIWRDGYYITSNIETNPNRDPDATGANVFVMQRDRMLARIMLKQMLRPAPHQGGRGHHLGIKQRAPRKLAMQKAAMTVRPVHHGCNGQAGGADYIRFPLFIWVSLLSHLFHFPLFRVCLPLFRPPVQQVVAPLSICALPCACCCKSTLPTVRK